MTARTNDHAAYDYVGYEYLTVNAAADRQSMLADGYRAFGWQLLDADARTLRFRRERAIANKTEVSRLQRQYEAQVAQLDDLAAAPARNGRIAGLSLGLVGCAFLAGATFSYLAGLVALMVVLAVPGFACWIAAYPAARKVASAAARRAGALSERLYDANDDVCRRAAALLA
ncbi:hypothetical protein G1C96_0557 [Bifidobacterium sp. DSM 109958]|uniref:Uncharacterized protein n=2 Tax=Bifidobacterium moraviense TaxID=2675323 RepID=A0A7Y0HZ96_9BIFI|nr:hypothetical protein [Bifidobacterium sp. DSM 109958]